MNECEIQFTRQLWEYLMKRESLDLNPNDERLLLEISQFYVSGKDYWKLTFEENLQLVNQDGNVVDKVTISVEKSGQSEDSFEVYQYSQDEKLMLRTRSHVTTSLGTVSEVRKMKQNETSKLLRISNNINTYRVFMVETDLELRTGSRVNMELNKSECEPLVLEGANVILLRKLAMSRQIGNFMTHTVNNDGEFCEAYYVVEDLSPNIVQVTRIVGSETMTTVLTTTGRIVHHKWSTSQWKLESQSSWGEKSREELGEGWDEVEGGSEHEAMVDLEAYWQRKQEVIAQLEEYTVRHCSVQDMIGDLIKNLLFEKPDDPIDFADKFLSESLGISRDEDEAGEESENSI